MDIFAILTAFTRKAFDTELNTSMLARNITAFRMLTEENAVTEKGEKIQVAVQVREHKGRSVKSGVEPYPATIIQPYETFDLEWSRYMNGMAIDGLTYKLNTGQDLEKAIGAGMGILSDGTAKTLINIHKNELMDLVATCQREISEMIYADGSGNGGADLQGFDLIMDSSRGYGGREPEEFEYHDWEQSLDGGINPQDNGRPARHAPFEKVISGALHVYGDLENLLIDLNRRGGKHVKAQDRVPMMEHWLFMSQPVYSDITGVLRDVLRRPTTGSGADAEIGGFRDGMYWDEYNARLFPDSDCPSETIYAFNRHCLKYVQMDGDQKYMKKWRLSDSQDSILIPFYKDHQLRCDDRSQTGRLRGFTSVTD